MPQAMALARRFMDDIISSPVNICLVGLIVYFSYKLMKKDTSSSKNKKASSVKQLAPMPKQDFTLDQLRPFDGVNSDGRILIGILGRVFDVSSRPEFYGPGGSYSVFAGRDASRALASFSVEASQFKETHDDLSDLTQSQLDSVKEWEMQFLEKYPVVGKILKPDEEPTDYSAETSKTDDSTTEKKEL